MTILFIIFGIVVILFLWFQYTVYNEYYWAYAKTRVDVDNKTIDIKGKIISFADINEVCVRPLDIGFAERYLTSIRLIDGVYEMKLILNDGTTEIVRLPKNYILAFCKQMKSAGVKIRETW